MRNALASTALLSLFQLSLSLSFPGSCHSRALSPGGPNGRGQVVGSVTLAEQALAGHAGRRAQGLKAWGWLARAVYRVGGGPGLIPARTSTVGPCSAADAARLWFCLSASLAHHAKQDRNGSHPASCEAAIRIFLETVKLARAREREKERRVGRRRRGCYLARTHAPLMYARCTQARAHTQTLGGGITQFSWLADACCKHAHLRNETPCALLCGGFCGRFALRVACVCVA